MHKQRNNPERVRRNQEKAVTITEARAKRSNADQVACLDARLGVGVGAKKERSRLEIQNELKA
jgi:hypothetical protein